MSYRYDLMYHYYKNKIIQFFATNWGRFFWFFSISWKKKFLPPIFMNTKLIINFLIIFLSFIIFFNFTFWIFHSNFIKYYLTYVENIILLKMYFLAKFDTFFVTPIWTYLWTKGPIFFIFTNNYYCSMDILIFQYDVIMFLQHSIYTAILCFITYFKLFIIKGILLIFFLLFLINLLVDYVTNEYIRILTFCLFCYFLTLYLYIDFSIFSNLFN